MEPQWDGGTKVFSRGLVHMTKMAATPIYGKNPSKIFFSRTKGPMTLWLGMKHWRLGPIIICSNDDHRLTLTCFTARSNLVSYAFIWGKTVRKSFNGRNLQQMTRVTKGLCSYKNSDPKGFSAPAPGLYTCIKTWKIMYKNQTSKVFFWNLQQMGKVTRLFCWHQDFVHKGLSAPAPELYTCGKTLKNVYKIRIQRNLFEACNKWSKW